MILIFTQLLNEYFIVQQLLRSDLSPTDYSQACKRIKEIEIKLNTLIKPLCEHSNISPKEKDNMYRKCLDCGEIIAPFGL
jgi:hypothetical protein